MTTSTGTAPVLADGPSQRSQDDGTVPVFARWFGSWRIAVHRRALSLPELARTYDRAAPGWSWTLDRLGVPGAYETLLRDVLAEAAPGVTGANLRVLDCGVGTGALSGALARVLPAPFRLDAIDISPEMLARAGRRLLETDLRVSLRRADVSDLPYRDGLFDLVMGAHVLEHLAEPKRALGELARVLKPGGLLIACVTRRSALGAYVQLKWRTHRVTPAEAEGWLRDSGLENPRCRSVGRNALYQGLSIACVGRKPLSGGSF